MTTNTSDQEYIFEIEKRHAELCNKILELEDKIEEYEFERKLKLYVSDKDKDELKKSVYVYPLHKYTSIQFVSKFESKENCFKHIKIKENSSFTHNPFTPFDYIELRYTDVKELIKFLQEYIKDVDSEYEKVKDGKDE
jgi:hypothetical protein